MRNLMFYVTKDSAKEAQKQLANKGIKATIFKMTKSEKLAYSNIYNYYIRYNI